ncbi:hypothetical protein HYFRA_00007056 [Hymenoscyphus fraxineus]|uniref:Methyltransferase type 11 domain-containing protein n=1 Tax=Hymenoscyphus fraxineus TaxID=746836 RepID=A0A9N9PUZ4_9HELO|nr:hypothetical protein HYFRA_00007056 [Hymenoscyphus fraxineus]
MTTPTAPSPISQPQPLLWDTPSFTTNYLKAEHITRPCAALLLQRTGLEKALQDPEYAGEKLVVLDQACGTGVVTKALMDILVGDRNKVRVTSADFAEAMVQFVRGRTECEGWGEVVEGKTHLPANKYTHLLFNFGPFLLPSPAAGIRESYRLLQSTGWIATSTWCTVPWLADMRCAFATEPRLPALPPMAEILTAFNEVEERWDSPEAAKLHLEKGGFLDVQAERVRGSAMWEGVGDLVDLLPGTLGVLKMGWSEEERLWRSGLGDAMGRGRLSGSGRRLLRRGGRGEECGWLLRTCHLKIMFGY